MKRFLLRQKVLPLNHQDIGKSLSNMGECYERLHQLKLALAIYEQCLPYSHQDRLNLELQIERLSEEIEEINI